MQGYAEVLIKAGSPGALLVERLQSGADPVCACGLRGSAPALLMRLLHARVPRTMLVVQPTDDAARAFVDEFAFFSTGGDLSVPEVLLYPAPDTRPYENVLCRCEVSAARLWALYRLCVADTPLVVVTSVRALLQRTLPIELLIDLSQTIAEGDELDRDLLAARLQEAGYSRVGMVEDCGDVSIRGDLIDLFPPGYTQPIRIELFGDSVDSIRLFDPASQRSTGTLSAAVVVPVREVVLNSEVRATVGQRAETEPFRQQLDTARGRAFCDSLCNGLMPASAEWCLPLLYPHLGTLFECLPEDTLVVTCDSRSVAAEAGQLWQDLGSRYRAAREQQRIAAPPETLFLAAEFPGSHGADFQQLRIEPIGIDAATDVSFAMAANDDIRSAVQDVDSPAGALAHLMPRFEHWLDEGLRLCLICRTDSQCARLAGLLHDHGMETVVHGDRPLFDVLAQPAGVAVDIVVGRLRQGFRYPQGLVAVITETELFGEKRRRAVVPVHPAGAAITDFSTLKSGDLLVHRDNGIGRYCQLATLHAGGKHADYLQLEYLGGDKLYLPVGRINLVSRYEHADDSVPRLDKLGGKTWERTRQRVRKSIEKVARELVDLYSRRKVQEGHGYPAPDHLYHEFEAAFPFEETPDQLAAIEDVMGDMSRPMPMDRLICGDVGYGKTEVALRAAFRAVMDGKQVAVLVPTTVLAQQHYLTFRERFAPYPVQVDILSRFRTAADQKQTIARLRDGRVDIVVGTHRLVSKDVAFRDLGLLVIDEEHRFGVRHKEQIKQLRSSVDVLTLTATPIPRTLQLSLFGVRDFSTIETPPEDRLAIRTVITGFDETVIRDAVERELQRGGQVFFVHDRVRSIPAMLHFLKQQLPAVRIGVAHGQLNERELEQVMMQFVNRDIDLLLCTTIIESGLDFPTANTIIINNAHRLGLAQMYQLRGRVGRGKVRAYAYLLVPGRSVLNRDAVRRLEALSEFSELGSGYRLATRDLQIRGAGNILGHAQSGQISAVGLDTYLDMLADAIAALRGKALLPEIDPEINLNVQAYLPEEYVADVNQRLVLYRRLAAAADEAAVVDLEAELKDRFGSLPVPVQTLCELGRLRVVLRACLVTALDEVDGQLVYSFHAGASDNLERVLQLVADDPQRFRFSPDHRLFVRFRAQGEHDLVREAAALLR